MQVRRPADLKPPTMESLPVSVLGPNICDIWPQWDVNMCIAMLWPVAWISLILFKSTFDTWDSGMAMSGHRLLHYIGPDFLYPSNYFHELLVCRFHSWSLEDELYRPLWSCDLLTCCTMQLTWRRNIGEGHERKDAKDRVGADRLEKYQETGLG